MLIALVIIVPQKAEAKQLNIHNKYINESTNYGIWMIDNAECLSSDEARKLERGVMKDITEYSDVIFMSTKHNAFQDVKDIDKDAIEPSYINAIIANMYDGNAYAFDGSTPITILLLDFDTRQIYLCGYVPNDTVGKSVVNENSNKIATDYHQYFTDEDYYDGINGMFTEVYDTFKTNGVCTGTLGTAKWDRNSEDVVNSAASESSVSESQQRWLDNNYRQSSSDIDNKYKSKFQLLLIICEVAALVAIIRSLPKHHK